MKSTPFFAIITAVWILGSGNANAAPLDNWSLRNPTVAPGNYIGVAFANGKFVALAAGGSTLISSNGIDWTTGGTVSFAATCLGSGNGRFFMGAGNGGAWMSTNGVTWTSAGFPGNNYMRGFNYGKGLYVAVSDLDIFGGNLSTSDDGTFWTFRTNGISQNLYSIAFGAGTFVVVGQFGNIASSSSGTNWIRQTAVTSYDLLGAAFGNGVFVAVGSLGTILTSTNGIDWVSRNSGVSASLSAVTFGNGTFVACGGGGTLLTSTDGSTWTSRSSGTSTPLNGVAFGNNAFVACGDGSTFARSTNSVNWTLSGSVASQLITSVVRGSSNFVAVGFTGTALSSSDGVSWISRNSGTTQHLYSVAYGNGVFAAVGQIILSSTDGISWTTRDSSPGLSLQTVAYANGLFIAVGDNGSMRVSTNGTDWSARSSGTSTTLYGITYGNAKYVVTGAGGLIRTSPDGLTWTPRASGSSQDLNGVTYGNGLFVIQGNFGVILSSTDALTWTPRSSGTGQGLATSAFGSGNFVVVGTGGTILSSTNAINWVPRTSGVSALLVGVAFGTGSTNGTFVAVGDGGIILQSDALPAGPVITVQPQNQTVACGTNRTFTVVAAGTPPLTYQWNKNGTPIAGATTNSYSATPPACQSIDSYTVIITNSIGVVTSSVASLTIVDTNPPSILCPSNLVLNAQPGQCSAVAAYSLSGTDNCSGLTLIGYPASGSSFPVGTNAVLCVAVDCGGNSNTCAFTVTVLDREAPTVSCPTNQVVTCNGTNGAQAFFSPTALDGCQGPVPVLCTPPSGSYFLLGTNIVVCEAKDSSGNSNSCVFTVIVEEPAPRLAIEQNPTEILLSWPQSCASYLVEQKSSLDATPDWAPINIAPIPTGTRFTLPLPMEGETRVFRLRKQ